MCDRRPLLLGRRRRAGRRRGARTGERTRCGGLVDHVAAHGNARLGETGGDLVRVEPALAGYVRNATLGHPGSNPTNRPGPGFRARAPPDRAESRPEREAGV
jgi:hypothetical protein